MPLIDDLPKPRWVEEAKKKTVEKEKKRVDWFSNAQCQGCYYKASSYCWRNCDVNIWKKRSEY